MNNANPDKVTCGPGSVSWSDQLTPVRSSQLRVLGCWSLPERECQDSGVNLDNHLKGTTCIRAFVQCRFDDPR